MQHTVCTHATHSMHTRNTQYAHTQHTVCTHATHSMHTHNAEYAHSMHTHNTQYTHTYSMQTHTKCSKTDEGGLGLTSLNICVALVLTQNCSRCLHTWQEEEESKEKWTCLPAGTVREVGRCHSRDLDHSLLHHHFKTINANWIMNLEL